MTSAFLHIGLVIVGSVFGTRDRIVSERRRKRGSTSLTRFSVDASQRIAFETAWNAVTHYVSNRGGYGYTKLYSSLNWEAMPYQYLMIRDWRDSSAFEALSTDNEFLKLESALRSHCKTQSQMESVDVLIDDSLTRIIQ